jgi:formylglycine-generating enzyme required for sulfatase activity
VRCAHDKYRSRARSARYIGYGTKLQENKVSVLKIILLALVFIAFQAQAKEDRNLAVTSGTSAGKRIALVIGNGNYQHTEILKKLPNPAHDAEDIAKALRGFGFEVIEKKDQSQESMRDAIAEFSRKIADSDAALFYYAGHGLQVKGHNYLVPVDAKIETEAQAASRSINVSEILEEMDNAKSKVNIVMLDACRSNDFSGKFRSNATRGLAAITSQPKGTVIVYATDPGNVAADGDGRNGLFTAGLLTAFSGSDLSLRGVLVRASKEVERGSNKKQTPYINGPATLQEEFHFGQGTQVASLIPVPTPTQPVTRLKSKEEIEQDTWDSVRDSGSIASIQEYLKQYPKGRFAGQAKVLIANLKSTPAKPAEPATTSPGREDNETALWVEIKNSTSKDDYDAYLSQYPKGKYIALAKSRIKKLDDEAATEASRKEQEAWESANSSASEESYQGYLDTYPKGRYATLAQGRITKLKNEAAQQAAQQAAQTRAQQAKQEREAAAQQAALARAEAEMRPGKVFKDCPDCPELVILPAGSFTMGSSKGGDESPAHSVTIRQPFALGKTEITRGQFAAFVNATSYDAGNECYVFEGAKWEKRSGRNWRNPGYQQDDSHPVACINWNDAKAYAEWLSRKTGKSYHLPTEAEWEYACRAGGQHEYCGSDNIDSIAWYGRKNGDTTHPSAQKQANAFGLYDMSGNVWEWVDDSYHDSYSGAPTDGTTWSGDGAKRVLRGGSWDSNPGSTRSASRNYRTPASRDFDFGFRVARTLP